MQTKRTFLIAGIVALLLIGAGAEWGWPLLRQGLNRQLPSEDPSAPPDAATFSQEIPAPGELPLGTFTRNLDEVLGPSQSPLNCASLDQIKKSLGPDDANSFWQGSSPENAQSFVYYDAKTRDLIVCDQGKTSTGVLAHDLGELTAEEEMIRVSSAQLSDMRGDGKKEFLLAEGQCVEGPCLGPTLLIQLDGAKLKKVASFEVSEVEIFKSNSHVIFGLTDDCHNYDFGSPLSYVAAVEFGPQGTLQALPFRKIPQLLPEFFQKFRTVKPRDPEANQSTKALDEIQGLIVQAYDPAVDSASLQASFERVLTGFPATPDQTDAGSRLGLYCQPDKILALISASK